MLVLSPVPVESSTEPRPSVSPDPCAMMAGVFLLLFFYFFFDHFRSSCPSCLLLLFLTLKPPPMTGLMSGRFCSFSHASKPQPFSHLVPRVPSALQGHNDLHDLTFKKFAPSHVFVA